jgi:hypothetical protein
MDANTLIFGSIAVISLAAFFFMGRYRASSKQRERDDRIDWSIRRFSLGKIFLYCLLLVGAVVLIAQFI